MDRARTTFTFALMLLILSASPSFADDTSFAFVFKSIDSVSRQTASPRGDNQYRININGTVVWHDREGPSQLALVFDPYDAEISTFETCVDWALQARNDQKSEFVASGVGSIQPNGYLNVPHFHVIVNDDSYDHRIRCGINF